MPNKSNSNSYLVLYLVIILVLLYAITFMSSYTCNISPKENFETQSAPALTPNDFTVIAVGYANQVYIQDVIGGQWHPNSTAVLNSQAVIDLCASPTGIIYGVGTDNNIYSRQNLNASWVKTNIDGKWRTVSIANDGVTLLLGGTDSHIYTFNISTNNGFAPAQMLGKNAGVYKIIQLQDNSYLIVGGGGNDTLYTTTNPVNGWTIASNHDVGIVSVAQAPNGQILGLKKDGIIYTKGGDWNTWNKTVCGGFTAIAVYPIPPQNINGYSRMGAFIDDNSRTIPNFIGNFNTLPECISAAQSQGYNTVGYQYMTQCFAGNNSPYDKNGFQTDNTKSVSAYPSAMTNIVYKTTQELATTGDPNEGEVFVYQGCQFTGAGSKMTIGQYPTLDNSVSIKAVKLGINTKLTLYTQPNFQGTVGAFYGNSDVVNKDASCINFTFSSAKVEKYNAIPSKPSELSTTQLSNLWTQVGCKAESMGFNTTNINNWRNKNTIADVVADMKNWATSANQEMKQGCYTMSPQPDIPNEGEIVLFENCDFGGRYKKFGMGNVSYVGNDFNDITSSIKIGPYTSLTIYENSNYGGKSVSWKNDSNSISVISCLTSNNFDNMLSSLKVSSSTAQVNNNISTQANPVVSLGAWNNSKWNMSSFVDTTAQWIWNNLFQGSSFDNKPVRFQLLVPQTGTRDIPVVIHVIASNAPQGANFVRLNGKLIGQIIDGGWATPNYTKIDTVLAPGNNLLEFDVQKLGNNGGLLVSVINSNTNEVVANSGSGQWGWIDPSKITSSELLGDIGSEFVIHDEAAKGKIVKFKQLNEITQMTVGGTFRLTVNLKNVPPYIKGQQYKEGDVNQFYLSIEKIDPNCQVEDGNKCLNIYVDNKKCTNATLSNISRTNAYRLVLVPKAYALDPEVPFGKNVDFTLIKIGDKYYLKNIQTGYMPKLFTNDYKQQLYGYMDTNYLSNISSLKSNNNKLCGVGSITPAETPTEENKTIGNIFGKAINGLFGNTKTGPRADQQFVNCSTNADGSMYMLTTTNLAESNPLKFVLNKDGTVNIRLQTFNTYGNLDKTYSLIYCNFNVNTYAFIEKLTNPLGTFLINMVCFDPDDKRQLPNNTLNFDFEISKYPDAYLKEKNIYNLNN